MSKLHDFSSFLERNLFLEKKLNLDLNPVKENFADKNQTEKVHCENLIGGICVPVGIAGPVKVLAIENKFEKEVFVPLATTEGALVASVSRGFKAINELGGVSTLVNEIGVTRGPVFATKSLKESYNFVNYLRENKEKIKNVLESDSKYLKLLKIKEKIIGNSIYLRLYFNSGEAMGMNMATIATQRLVKFLEKDYPKVECLSVSGNYCIDKKPAWLNFINGRGLEINAEVILDKNTLKNVLKTDSQKMFDVWLSKCMIGSAISGSLGFNLHFANIASAFFIATGQDPAQVVEASLGMTVCKVLKNGNLYISVYLPAVMLATIGGGTKLKTQEAMLKLIGVKNKIDLARVFASTILAGELSLLAAQANGTLAKSHQKLGR
jgi:hydroxymethylglutaryl-CoA reductase (NADPH)